MASVPSLMQFERSKLKFSHYKSHSYPDKEVGNLTSWVVNEVIVVIVVII